MVQDAVELLLIAATWKLFLAKVSGRYYHLIALPEELAAIEVLREKDLVVRRNLYGQRVWFW